MNKVWFITGSSRGLGYSLTEAVLANGGLVAATARHPESLKNLAEKYPGQIHLIKLDVSDEQQVNNAVAEAIAHFGRLDVVVNNAGFGITGPAETFTAEQITSQINTNLYGPIYVTRAVLPQLRKQRSGHILQVSSIGGRITNPGLSIYQATKFGLVGFSESLQKELAPLGIKLTIVEPGGFRTDWAGASMTYAEIPEDYKPTVGAVAAFLNSPEFKPIGDPVKAAKVLIDLAEHPEPPVHLVLGSEAVAFLKQADSVRSAELEKWMDVSISTDHDNAENFMTSDVVKTLTGK